MLKAVPSACLLQGCEQAWGQMRTPGWHSDGQFHAIWWQLVAASETRWLSSPQGPQLAAAPPAWLCRCSSSHPLPLHIASPASHQPISQLQQIALNALSRSVWIAQAQDMSAISRCSLSERCDFRSKLCHAKHMPSAGEAKAQRDEGGRCVQCIADCMLTSICSSLRLVDSLKSSVT